MKSKTNLLVSAARSIFFLWLNPLLATGSKKPIEKCDIPALDDDDTTDKSYTRLLESLKAEVRDGRRHYTCGSLFVAIARCHWREICRTGVLALLKTLAISSNPLFLRFLTTFATNRDQRRGYILVVALSLTKIVECLAERHWFFGARRLGLRLRSSLVAAIYDKELKLSHQSRQRHSSGEIVSYISVDAYRLGEFVWWSHQLWTIPLQIAIALAILVSMVRLATLSGLFVILVTAAIQAPLAKFQQRNQLKFMVAQDHRLRVSSSVFSSMKIIKFQGWETYFQQLIDKFRREEYRWLNGVKQFWAMGSLMYWISPVLTASVVFATCIALSIELDAILVFTVLATFRVIQDPVKNLPDVLTSAIQARVSLQRLARFLNDEEIQEDAVERVSSTLQGPEPDVAVVSVDSATFAWEKSNETVALADMNLRVRRNDFVAVCGAVGSGKSTLLHSILGEVPRLSGTTKVCGTVAYVSQTAWIRSGTVRENILFGGSMDTSFYERVIKACALEEDIASFSHGDLTEIGERGLNLSGGQKQRIQLARALYANADLYLLDDPFSAVDSQTAAILFQACLLDELKNKTVILVTHQVEFLPAANEILVMDSGRIVQSGTYEELLGSSSNVLERLVNAHGNSLISQVKQTDEEHHHQIGAYGSKKISNETKLTCQQLTKEEETTLGSVGLKPYLNYINNTKGGTYLLAITILLQVYFSASMVWSNYWLATKITNTGISKWLVIGVFAAVSCVSCGTVYVRSRFSVAMGLRASRDFFARLNNSLFRAPMAVFDSTPLGRILSRASADMSLLDIEVQTCFSSSLVGLIGIAANLVAISLVTWQTLVIAIPALVFLQRIQSYCSKSAGELVRINGKTKAPILNHIGETVDGAVTIRAFRKQDMFMQQILEFVNDDAAVSVLVYGAYEWVFLRVEFLCASIISTVALLSVIFGERKSSGFVALALTYAFSLNTCIMFLTQALNYLSSYIISVERISQYTRLPEEAPLVISTNRPHSSWPTHGEVELENLQIRYRPNSPLVLKGISCKFPAGKRVGLVGRTGSGKTTLVTALFRLVEPAGGRVCIDGVDITTIGLFDLRTRLGVIPQEAFLFRGTVRSNLDPLQQYTDEQIWQSLQKCQLLSASMELDSPVTDDGENWSAGQRQLFCLARALLKCSKVLVLDEATASVDSTTDAVLQKVIREEFRGCTVITVAHRIPTVIDSDLILGLKDGCRVEYDTPQALLHDKNSLFASLVSEYYARCETEHTNSGSIQ